MVSEDELFFGLSKEEKSNRFVEILKEFKLDARLTFSLFLNLPEKRKDDFLGQIEDFVWNSILNKTWKGRFYTSQNS